MISLVVDGCADCIQLLLVLDTWDTSRALPLNVSLAVLCHCFVDIICMIRFCQHAVALTTTKGGTCLYVSGMLKPLPNHMPFYVSDGVLFTVVSRCPSCFAEAYILYHHIFEIDEESDTGVGRYPYGRVAGNVLHIPACNDRSAKTTLHDV